MSSSSSGGAGRAPLSMQTEHARQQQLITLSMLLLLLGPPALAVAGGLAAAVGRSPRRRAACAGVGLLALAAAGWFWRDYQALALDAWAAWSGAYQDIQAQAATPDYWQLARRCWPPLWAWWRCALPLAPLAALNLLATRVRSAEELERERFERAERAAAAQERRVRARLEQAPASKDGAMVLGAPLAAGDLPWSRGELFTYPADSLARHSAVIGSSGMGKSETVLRLAYGARQAYGWKVFFIDCKGELALQERFAATMRAAGATRIGQFPQRPLQGWQGDSVALLNRLLAVIDYSEAYYRDLTKMLLNLTLEAPGGPARSSRELLEGMLLSRLRQRYQGRPEVDEIDGLRPRDAAAAYNRYRAFFRSLGGGLDGAPGDDGAWSFDTVDVGYIRLDGLTLKDQTASLGRYLIEDFAHYAARRKPKDERALLIIDEYPVLAFSGAGTASLFEMVRFHGASVVVTGQSYAGMGEGFERILGAAETLILHRCGDPDRLLPRAGQRLGFKRRIGFAERGLGRGAREFATGAGYLAVDEELKIHPNDVRELPPGECFVIAGGQYQRVLVKRASLVAPAPVPLPDTTTPALGAGPTRRLVLEVERAPEAGLPPEQADRTPPSAVLGAAAGAATASTNDFSPAAAAAPGYRDEDDS